MDKNGYFFYVTSTAKKKKINLMQPKPPRVAFVDEKRRPGVAERVYTNISIPNSNNTSSVALTATENGRGDYMTQRGISPAPRARLYTQLESYQPRYHTIRDNSDKKVESECRRKKKERERIVAYQPVVRLVMFALIFYWQLKTEIKNELTMKVYNYSFWVLNIYSVLKILF